MGSGDRGHPFIMVICGSDIYWFGNRLGGETVFRGGVEVELGFAGLKDCQDFFLLTVKK